MNTSPPALGAISAGIRYQIRFFWWQALPMLYSGGVAKVVLEHRGIDAVDDVVVYYGAPGVNARGTLVTADFYQLKFHVAMSGAIGHEVVIDPAWTGTKSALLKRLADAWLSLRQAHPNARLSLVTNWPWDPASPIAPLLRDGGHLDDKFFTSTGRSDVGKIRETWEAASSLSASDFATFARSLRFSTSAASQDEAGMQLSDRCRLAGLVPLRLDVEHSPYDDLGKRLLETGRTEHTPESLKKLVEGEGLIQTGKPAFKSTFAVRSFSLYAHVPASDGAAVVDLTDLFEKRKPRSPDVWNGPARDRLDNSTASIATLAEPVHVALDAHLSVAWYAGRLFDPRAGRRVLLRQAVRGHGIELWDVSTPIRPEGKSPWEISQTSVSEGRDIALVISTTHSALTDASRYVTSSLPSVGTVVHAELPEKGHQAVKDGGHARWLADDLLTRLNEKVSDLRPGWIHVFPACPASLAFLLGQASTVLGPMTIYEFDFGSAERTYRAGMSTGVTEISI